MSVQELINNKGDLTAAHSADLAEHRAAEFLPLYEADRKRLYAYIYAYVMDKAAADDIFQETSMVLWRDFHVFELGTHFSKWANGIAFNRIRVYRRQYKHLSLQLSEERLDEIFGADSFDHNHEHQWQLLQTCRAQLRLKDKTLYQAFYQENKTASEIAELAGRSIFAVRKSIHHLRKKLFDCVDSKQREDLF